MPINCGTPVQAMRANRIVVHRWAALLGSVVGPGPPPGVRVRPPRRGAAFVAMMAIKGLVLLAALAAVTIVPLVIAAG